MPFGQSEAQNSSTVQPVKGTRGRLKLWQKGEEVMVEIYGPFGPLQGSITVRGQELEEAISDLGAWT